MINCSITAVTDICRLLINNEEISRDDRDVSHLEYLKWMLAQRELEKITSLREKIKENMTPCALLYH